MALSKLEGGEGGVREREGKEKRERMNESERGWGAREIEDEGR